MPEMKNYTVTQTRQVKVWANNLEGAVEVAQSAFKNGQQGLRLQPGPIMRNPGNTMSLVEETHIVVEKDTP